MGCPRHLQWSPIKEESVAEELVEPSQGISPRGGLKGKRQGEKRGSAFSSPSSSSNLLSPRVRHLQMLFVGFLFDRNDGMWMTLNVIVVVFSFSLF